MLNDFINDLADKDTDFLTFLGTVNVEQLIKNHKNPDLIRNILCDRAFRNLKEILYIWNGLALMDMLLYRQTKIKF